MPRLGKVYLIGAGPGDPGLLTLRGKERLERADVVVYDALINPELLRHAPNAEHVFAGKTRGLHSLPQEEINRILIELARRHAHVARLKGGDPFVFGRGGEEALALAQAGIPFEVVPGVTAGIAAPAYAGIPVTHRGISSTVTFLTAHLDESGALPDPQTLLREGTLVLYMGVRSLEQTARALVDSGRAPHTPAAVIEWGTYARQRAITGTLADIAGRCAEAAIEAPALVVVGEVTRLRDQMRWFETRPLHGLRVVVTHAIDRQGPLESRLRELGAEVFCLPMLHIAPALELDWTPGEFDWILLTSVNAAKMLFDRLDALGLDARALAGVRLCAVGAATREAVEARYLMVDAAPEVHGTESVISALQEQGPLRDKRVLLPRSDIARRSLPDALRAAGATVTESVAYVRETTEVSREDADALRAFAPGLLVFTNAGAIENFAAAFPEEYRETPAASIGPVTSDAALAAGFQVVVEPVRHSVPELIEAVCRWWEQEKKGATDELK